MSAHIIYHGANSFAEHSSLIMIWKSRSHLQQSGTATVAMSSFFFLILRSIDPRRRQNKGWDESAPKWRSNDTVLPVHAIDNIPTLRGIVTSQALRFDDVLDADLLYSSLTELFNTGNWKKFGGRFRLNVRSP